VTFLEAIGKIQTEASLTIVLAWRFSRPMPAMIESGHVIENGYAHSGGWRSRLMDDPEVKATYFGV
jgi:ABC-type branched-subunit amino acid transport system ATPase component